MASETASARLRKINPYQINVSDQNERVENVSTDGLEDSVAENGVIQPVIVRERGEKEVPYEVVIGQRRTLAAQAVDCSEVPAVVVNWDDAEALEKSISENIDAFRNDVSKRDRARAIERLKEMRGWTNSDVADSLGVGNQTISRWLEYTRNEWEGTSIHPEADGNENPVNENEEIDADTLSEARKMTGGGEEGEQVVEEAAELDLSQEDMREARKEAEQGKDPVEAVHDVAEEKAKKQLGRVKVRSSVTFTGNRAEAVQRIAQERGTTENKIVEEAVETFLNREGYL